MPALNRRFEPEKMKPIAYSWIARMLVERGNNSYTALDIEEALIAALSPTQEELEITGDKGCPSFVNNEAHVLKRLTDLKFHTRPARAKRAEPYHLTEKGRSFFQSYYSDRHGR
jgi:hypothetical protein